jgi:SET domain-containing protein
MADAASPGAGAAAEALHDLPPHLEVKASLIPGAGMGLFARRLIKNNRKIGRYRGIYYASRSDGDSLPASHKPYLMDTIYTVSRSGRGDTGIIDGYTLRNHMRWANHSIKPNAYAHLESDGVVFFKALRDIQAGDEIYIDYGYDPTVPDTTSVGHGHHPTVPDSTS